MAVSTDILRTWRGPRAVMRDLLEMGQREDRAIAYIMASCILIFIAQGPRLSRQAAGFETAESAVPRDLTVMLSYELFAWIIIWPLIFYAIAALVHIIAKVFRAKGSFYTARLAMFWALLASTPLLLLHGLSAGFIGPGPQTNLVGVLWIAAFAYFWVQCFRETQA